MDRLCWVRSTEGNSTYSRNTPNHTATSTSRIRAIKSYRNRTGDASDFSHFFGGSIVLLRLTWGLRQMLPIRVQSEFEPV